MARASGCSDEDLDGGSDQQESIGVASEWAGSEGEAADEGVLAKGEGAGLIPDHGAQLPRRLEDGSVAHEDSRLRAPAGASDHGGGGGEAHGAGAGNHEHGNSRGHGANQARLGPEQVPADKGRHGDQQDGRDEHLGDAISEASNRRLRSLRTLDHGHDAGQRGVRTHLRRAHHDRGIGEERSGGESAPWAALDRK
jgi:hypothetical protein